MKAEFPRNRPNSAESRKSGRTDAAAANQVSIEAERGVHRAGETKRTAPGRRGRSNAAAKDVENVESLSKFNQAKIGSSRRPGNQCTIEARSKPGKRKLRGAHRPRYHQSTVARKQSLSAGQAYRVSNETQPAQQRPNRMFA